MAVDNALFSPSDLRDFLDLPGVADSGRAAMVERIVWGMVKPLLRPILDAPNERPGGDELDDTVFAIVIVLGGYLYDNPTAARQLAIGGETTEYASDLVAGQLEQLRQFVTDQAGGSSDGVPAPRGKFPPPSCYPDPVRDRVGWGRPYTW